MVYTTLEKKIHDLPEEYLDEVADFVEYILFKARKKENDIETGKSSAYFGCLNKAMDVLKIQKEMRDEWN